MTWSYSMKAAVCQIGMSSQGQAAVGTFVLAMRSAVWQVAVCAPSVIECLRAVNASWRTWRGRLLPSVNAVDTRLSSCYTIFRVVNVSTTQSLALGKEGHLCRAQVARSFVCTI